MEAWSGAGRGETTVKRKVWGAVLLLAVVAGTVVGMVAWSGGQKISPPARDAYGLASRTLQYETSVVLDRLPRPDFATLRRMGIGELGVSIWPDFLGRSDWWSLLRAWTDEVHREGFAATALIHDANIIVPLTPLIVSAGFDSIGYDELVSMGTLNRTDLFADIALARQLKSNIGISVTEYDLTVLESLHAWIKESRLSGFRMASSDYDNLTQAENINELLANAPLPSHRHGAWVIFISDFPHEWDAYLHLTTWLNNLINIHYDLLLWEIDGAGLWRQNWSAVESALTSGSQAGAVSLLGGLAVLSLAPCFASRPLPAP